MSDTSTTTSILFCDCKQASLTKTYNGKQLVYMNAILLMTNQMLMINYQWCCTDVCTTVEIFFLEIGEIATLNGKTVASDLGDVGGCSIAAGVAVKLTVQ